MSILLMEVFCVRIAIIQVQSLPDKLITKQGSLCEVDPLNHIVKR